MVLAFALTLAGAAALVAHTLWLGSQGRADAPALDAASMRPHVWWGLFYVNPADARGWVPKLTGVGWTVNYRSPAHVYAFLVSLGVTIAAVVALLSEGVRAT